MSSYIEENDLVHNYILGCIVLKVVETWWAIGSGPGDTDVQPFVKITTNQFVSNTSLAGLLLDSHTYFVTLMCVNGAGLKTANISRGESIYRHPRIRRVCIRYQRLEIDGMNS